MSREMISTTSAPAAIGPYSQAIRAGQFVYVSGQVPVDPVSGEIVPGGIEEQTEQVIANLKAVLYAAGRDLADVVKTTVFLTDMANFAKMNEIYAHHFTSSPPARSTVQVGALPRGAQVEIDAIAMAG